MPFERPALAEQIDRSRNDLLTRLGVDESLRRADKEAYARVIGGAVHGLYGFIDYISRQIIPDTADTEHLDRWASIWGVPRKAAAAATGQVTFSTTVGAFIPTGTLLKAVDGVDYQTTADATAVSSSTVAAIQAVDAGAAGNRLTGQSLTLVSPISGVQSVAVAGELSGGADIETDDSLRARLISRIQQPPHGGAEHDYIAWALEVAGVTRAWVFPQEMGVGTVTVRFVRDNDVSPIPDSGEVQAVQDYIEARRPVTAQVYVVAPLTYSVNLTIDLNPDTTAIRNAVQAELIDFFRREGAPGSTLYLSRIREAISSAAGEFSHALTAPVADIVLADNQVAQLGTITWL